MAIPSQASSAPARTRGTRSRAGNAMGRTREAALAGAVAAVAKYGSRKATMGDIAMLAGIAKATLYNHFRTRDDVYRAATVAEVDAIADAAAATLAGDAAASTAPSPAQAVRVALAEAARLVSEHPAARRIARDEPATLALLARPDAGAGWTAARAHAARVLAMAGAPAGDDGIDLVLRYLASLILAPATADETAAAAAALTRSVVRDNG